MTEVPIELIPCLLPDWRIKHLAAKGMITPFHNSLVREWKGKKVISYGLSSYGYDLRLSPDDFRIFRHIPGTVVDPKAFNENNLVQAELHEDRNGKFFILPAHSYGLGVALEYLSLPSNITALFIGKSTYARTGLIANLTPGEACMSDDTEILARTGWKKLSEVILGEEVLTWNPKRNRSEYQPVEDKQAYYFNGELLHFSSKYVDQMVTPQHKMWVGKKVRRVASLSDGRKDKQKGVQRKSYDSWNFNFLQAKDLFGSWNYFLSRDLEWEGFNPWGSRFKIGKYDFDLRDWLRFLGAWMGDGSAYVQQHGNYVVKLAVVTKDLKRKYFKNLLEQMEVNYFEGESGFEFRDKSVCEYLLPYAGSYNKRLPNEVKHLPPDLLECIIEGMMHSDGNIQTSTYGSVSKRLVDDFQEICMKAGYNCSQWEEDSVINEYAIHSWKARYSKPNSTPNKINPASNMHKVPYAGMVYDITVPNHIFLSRRNGRASWTGNSWHGHLTFEFSNSSSADIRIYAEEGVVQALFFESILCETPYDSSRKYQAQGQSVVTAKV